MHDGLTLCPPSGRTWNVNDISCLTLLHDPP